MKKALAFLLTVILAVTPVLAMASAAYTPGTYEDSQGLWRHRNR